jgi:hypothetical protein
MQVVERDSRVMREDRRRLIRTAQRSPIATHDEGVAMDQPRAEVIVASTLYLISGCVFDPTPCACRVHAIVAHLERMMQMEGLDPVLRATAIQLHENWRRVVQKIEAADEPSSQSHLVWH